MKQCNICLEFKQYSQFNKNGNIPDGYLNQCRECSSIIRRIRYNENLEKSRAKERRWNLIHYSKYGSDYWRKVAKAKARNAAQVLQRPFVEAQCHHWSYNEGHFLDVIWLTIKQHKKAHRFLIYDPDSKMFTGVHYDILLDSKEAHIDYITWCIENLED